MRHPLFEVPFSWRRYEGSADARREAVSGLPSWSSTSDVVHRRMCPCIYGGRGLWGPSHVHNEWVDVVLIFDYYYYYYRNIFRLFIICFFFLISSKSASYLIFFFFFSQIPSKKPSYWTTILSTWTTNSPRWCLKISNIEIATFWWELSQFSSNIIIIIIFFFFFSCKKCCFKIFTLPQHVFFCFFFFYKYNDNGMIVLRVVCLLIH